MQRVLISIDASVTEHSNLADFKRSAPQSILQHVAGLLKNYQEEVDRLTNRSA